MDLNWRSNLRNLWRDDRSTMWRLLAVGGLGVALVAWGSWGGAGAKPQAAGTPAAAAGGLGLAGQEAQLDQAVAAVVAAIPGSGRVHVAVALASGAKTQFATRHTSEQVVAPQVSGVVVVATGASAPGVRQEITTAVETLLQVSAYRVAVLPDGG